MDAKIEVKKNEVLRKIGRNIMLFQQMEHMLKFFIADGEISGYASELKKTYEQRRKIIDKQTMGQLSGKFFNNYFNNTDEVKNEPEKLTGPWLSIRHTIKFDSNHLKERKKELALIVAERNDLVHHFLPKWDMHSYRSSTEVELFLDKQREKILPAFEFFKSLIKSIQEMKKEVSAFIASDEGKKQFETIPRLMKSQLFEIAMKPSRPDGWVILSTALSIIHQNAPQEIDNLKKTYGTKKLKKAILATEVFDVTEEPTDKGGMRVLYRIKPEIKSTIKF